jgi:hypothetical protein
MYSCADSVFASHYRDANRVGAIVGIALRPILV